MWKKNYSEIYETVNSCPTWPNHLKNIMKLILESTRQRVITLITKAYSTISLNDASKLLGLTNEETLALGQQLNWSYEPESGFISINRDSSNQPNNKHTQAVLELDNGTELLEKLTDYIIFLESAR